jgi:hypothetical protein
MEVSIKTYRHGQKLSKGIPEFMKPQWHIWSWTDFVLVAFTLMLGSASLYLLLN